MDDVSGFFFLTSWNHVISWRPVQQNCSDSKTIGADNVLAGSDFPIVGGPIRGPLMDAMHQARLTDEEQSAIAAGNCLRLLRLA